MKAVSLALVALIGVASAANWAVLIAGSVGYENYNDQTNICHAYDILKTHGLDDDHIIVMTSTDTATDSENPHKGEWYNEPGDDPKEYYQNCKIDYADGEITVANFEAVLTGDSTATAGKPVLKSTKDDNVFIYMSDHGNIGIFGFPDETLYADTINKVLKTMHKKEMYKELAFYMLACHSGSYFDQGQLPKDINIYAITSATRYQSTLCEYCPPNDVVKGHSVGTCLSDQFSAAWMEDVDRKAGPKRTFNDQYKIIDKRMTYSDAVQFGDMSIAKQPIWNFIGAKKSNSYEAMYESLFLADDAEEINDRETAPSGIVPSDKRINHLYYRVIRNGGHKAELDLMEELNHRIRVDTTFKSFDYYMNLADVSSEETNYDCLRSLVATYEQHCGAFKDYVYEKTESLVKACNTDSKLEDIQSTLRDSCHA